MLEAYCNNCRKYHDINNMKQSPSADMTGYIFTCNDVKSCTTRKKALEAAPKLQPDDWGY